MTDLIVVTPTGGVNPHEQEVETEFEYDLDVADEEQQEPPCEVEEDLDEDATLSAAPASSGDAESEYQVPEENRDVWKNFGCDTEAGRALRRLYGGTQQKAAASRVSYPRLISPARKWEPQAVQQKACPQRAPINVPRGRRSTYDRDDPKNWYIPMPGRKPAAEILAEMEAHRPVKPNLQRGRDQGAEKKSLQDKFRYAGGNAMPSGAMGYVPKGEVPDPVKCRREMPERWNHVDETGLTKEQREIFADLTFAIQQKQARLAEIDGQDVAEEKPNKAKTQRNREALQLKNDIDGCVKDIDKLFEIADM